jgi:hypothetical protein
MLCCGPLTLRDRVDDPERAVAVFAADGSVVDGAWSPPVMSAHATEPNP